MTLCIIQKEQKSAGTVKKTSMAFVYKTVKKYMNI